MYKGLKENEKKMEQLKHWMEESNTVDFLEEPVYLRKVISPTLGVKAVCIDNSMHILQK